MKIAFVCIYSTPSICGVWSRVNNLAKMLHKEGHEVAVFSTNTVKGTHEKSPISENLEGTQFYRFSPKYSFGENVKFWDFSKELEKFNPDIIIAEVYRHPHTHLALKIAKKLNKPCFLVTHAPFVPPHLRSRFGNFLSKFYDKFLGKRILNKFDKIITITKWEVPYLLKIGAEKNKLGYIPNGIPEEFFSSPPKKGKNILFLGRISPVKQLETLIEAMGILQKKHPEIKLNLVGPSEESYKKMLEEKISLLNLNETVRFSPAVYELERKIKILDESNIFVLPSKREAMPQSLIEAMARGKIVLASENEGTSEIIQHRKNGFLFKSGNATELAELIDFSLNNKNQNSLKKVRQTAIKTAQKFRWEKLFVRFKSLLEDYAK